MALDIVIRGGMVFDGSERPAVSADVGISGGRIVALGKIETESRASLDATGLAVAPGFIDIHSHSDYTLLVDPRAVSAIAQGVTTEVIGNCGFGCAPIGDPNLARMGIYGFDGSVPIRWQRVGEYLDKLAAAIPAVNVLTLIPNGQLRLLAVGLADRPATDPEIGLMCDHLREGLDEGAAGYSIGLEYPTEIGCGHEELVALASEAGRKDALFAVHTRNRAVGAPAAVAEAIQIARKAQVRLQVSHLIPRSGEVEGQACVELVEAARDDAVPIAFDMHTRRYGTTMLSTLLPPWAFENGLTGLRKHLATGSSRERMKGFRSLIASLGDWDKIQLLDIPGRPDVSRLSLAEIGRRSGRDPHDCALDILLEEVENIERPMVILHAYSEDSQKLAFAHPLCAPGSDATTLAPDGPLATSTFHGAYTWAAWYWRSLVREWKLLKPEQAINRLTALPASIAGIADRGHITPGACADVVAFDPLTFGERGTTFEPNKLADGMRHVVVNGAVTLQDGKRTGLRNGSVLKRAKRTQ
jgi:N-acyl-D-aspartate/D-glutamate deacylase